VVPGWTDRQVCALTDHLSLFALGIRHVGERAAQVLAEAFGSIDALMARRDKLVALVDQMVQKKGESAVLFSDKQP
jgi:DNA ligase (NAD+)